MFGHGNTPTGVQDPASGGQIKLIEDSVELDLLNWELKFSVSLDGSYANHTIDLLEVDVDTMRKITVNQSKLINHCEQAMNEIKHYEWEPE